MLKIAINEKKALSQFPEEIFFRRERRLCLKYYFGSFYTIRKDFVKRASSFRK